MEEKVENSLELIGTEEDLVIRRPLTQELRSKINKWGPHETEKLLNGKRYCHLNKAKANRIGKDFY